MILHNGIYIFPKNYLILINFVIRYNIWMK